MPRRKPIPQRFSQSEKESLCQCRDHIQALTGKLSSRVKGYDENLPWAALTHYAVVWREALLHRIVDIGEAAHGAFLQRRLVPGNILTRALFETLALQFHYWQMAKKAIEEKDVALLREIVQRGVFGRKDKPGLPWDTEFPIPFQVLTVLDKMDKTFKGTREEYDHLCEYAHPNLKGTLGAYVQPSLPPSVDAKLGRGAVPYELATWGLSSLAIGLRLSIEIHGWITERESEIAALLGSDPDVGVQ